MYDGKKFLQQMVMKTLNSYMLKNETGSFSYTIHTKKTQNGLKT